MKKKDLLKKQELAEKLGMKFDEASELFSEESLETMKMINIMGGSAEGDNYVERCGCTTVNNVPLCGCESAKSGCDVKQNCGVNCSDKRADKCDKCGVTPTPPPTGDLPTPPPIEDLPTPPIAT